MYALIQSICQAVLTCSVVQAPGSGHRAPPPPQTKLRTWVSGQASPKTGWKESGRGGHAAFAAPRAPHPVHGPSSTSFRLLLLHLVHLTQRNSSHPQPPSSHFLLHPFRHQTSKNLFMLEQQRLYTFPLRMASQLGECVSRIVSSVFSSVSRGYGLQPGRVGNALFGNTIYCRLPY